MKLYNNIKIILSITTLIFYVVYLQIQVNNLSDDIDYNMDEISNLKSKVHDLEGEIDDNKSYSNSVEKSYYEYKISLKEKEIFALEYQQYTEDIFFSLIEGTNYEDYIVEHKYNSTGNSKLDRVTIKINETDKIFDYLQYLNHQYQLLYFKLNSK